MSWNLLRFKYNTDLHDHLNGIKLDGNPGGVVLYQYACIFVLVFFVFGTINYYYGYFNRPKYSTILTWLLNMLIMSIVVGIFSFLIVCSGINYKDPNGLHYYFVDCFLFALTVVCYNFFLSFIFSLIIKWWSLNNKAVPFLKTIYG